MREGLKKEEREGRREGASREKVLFLNNLKMMHNMFCFQTHNRPFHFKISK